MHNLTNSDEAQLSARSHRPLCTVLMPVIIISYAIIEPILYTKNRPTWVN